MDVICIGEALIDFVSRERGKTLVSANEYSAATGGSPANVAAGLAKLNRRSRMVATVGQDVFGEKILNDLQDAGVDCALRMDAEHFTTLAFVKQGASGKRDFDFSSGAHDYLLPEQIDADVINGSRVLHYSSIGLRSSFSREATLKAIGLARELGVVTACDPNWRPALWPDPEKGRAAMLEAISHADVLKISLADLAFLVPDIDNDYVAALNTIGFNGRLAVVTLGRDGAWYKRGEIEDQVPSPCVQVVDSTGAGDGFMASLLDSLLNHDMDIEGIDAETLRGIMLRASAAGALTTTGYGAIPSLPDNASIDTLLRFVTLGNGRVRAGNC